MRTRTKFFYGTENSKRHRLQIVGKSGTQPCGIENPLRRACWITFKLRVSVRKVIPLPIELKTRASSLIVSLSRIASRKSLPLTKWYLNLKFLDSGKASAKTNKTTFPVQLNLLMEWK